jgi:hypothetical protein
MKHTAARQFAGGRGSTAPVEVFRRRPIRYHFVQDSIAKLTYGKPHSVLSAAPLTLR